MERLDIYQSTRAYDLGAEVLEFVAMLANDCSDLMSHKPYPQEGDAATLAEEAPRLSKAAVALLTASMAHDPEAAIVTCWNLCRRNLGHRAWSVDTEEINDVYRFYGKMLTMCERLMGW